MDDGGKRAGGAHGGGKRAESAHVNPTMWAKTHDSPP